jgi:hypothetical protein
MNSAALLKSYVCLKDVPNHKNRFIFGSLKQENIMKSQATRSLVIGAFGVITLAGCASSPSTSSSAPTPVASAQESVRAGKVTAVERTAIVDQMAVGSSSGSSNVVTTASGGPSVVAVQFTDGKEAKYVIENPTAVHRVGESVYVVTSGEQTAIVEKK